MCSHSKYVQLKSGYAIETLQKSLPYYECLTKNIEGNSEKKQAVAEMGQAQLQLSYFNCLEYYNCTLVQL